jgi:hypothetical protein
LSAAVSGKTSLNDGDVAAYLDLDGHDAVDNLLRKANITAHYAIPPRWRWTPTFKSRLAFVLVLFMAGASMAGVILQIQTSATTSWDCTTL